MKIQSLIVVMIITVLPYQAHAVGFGIISNTARPVDTALAPEPPLLERLEIASSIQYRPGEANVAPVVEMFGKESGYFSKNNQNHYYDITYNLRFQSGMEPADNKELADQFNISGGDGTFHVDAGYNYKPNDNYMVKIAGSAGYTWLQANEQAPDSSVTEIDSGIIQYKGSIGLWLKFAYFGYEKTFNSVDGVAGNNFETSVDDTEVDTIRFAVPIGSEKDGFYFQMLHIRDSSSSDRSSQFEIVKNFKAF